MILGIASIVLTILFTLFWGYVCYLTIAYPPTDDPWELAFLAVILGAGVATIARAILCGT